MAGKDDIVAVAERSQPGPAATWRKDYLARLLPIAAFGVIAVLLGLGLTLRPSEVPSVLIGKPVPVFELAPVKGRNLGLSNKDLVGQVSLVNVFASWCVACLAEHPFFLKLAAEKIVPIHGLNYKDLPDDAAAWLDKWGDPYTRTGADRIGRVAIDFGVYGVPETFVIDHSGRIVFKQIGPLDQDTIDKTILPLIAKLKR